MAERPHSKTSTASSTDAVHAGEPRHYTDGAVTSPITLASTFAFENTAEMRDHFEGRAQHHEYGRYGNPTVEIAEQKVAELDAAESSALFSSGMAAITTTLLSMLKSGQHVVLTSDCYRRTRQFVLSVLPRFGIDATMVEPGDYAAMQAAIRPGKTRLIVAESPTNPYLRVVDMEKLAAIRDRHPAVKILIDSTFASPINQRPHLQGADLVVHSCTKFLGGHNDLLGGAVSGAAALISAIRDFRGVMGGVMDPHSAYLLIRGMKTLALRVERQSASALAIASYLEQHPRVSRLHYPGLASHPDHQVALRTMRGFGAVVSFNLADDEKGTARFVDACRIPRIAPSLGGVESLIEQPALMSFYELSSEERAAVGISDNLVRYSVGLEDAADLIEDLARALEV